MLSSCVRARSRNHIVRGSVHDLVYGYPVSAVDIGVERALRCSIRNRV